MPESMELKRGRSKKGRDDKSVVYKVQKKRCNKRKSIGTRKERDSMSRMQNRKKETMVELRSGGIPHRGKNAVGQYINRGSEKCSNRGDWPKEYQENIQNVERGVIEYWSRKGKYA